MITNQNVVNRSSDSIARRRRTWGRTRSNQRQGTPPCTLREGGRGALCGWRWNAHPPLPASGMIAAEPLLVKTSSIEGVRRAFGSPRRRDRQRSSSFRRIEKVEGRGGGGHWVPARRRGPPASMACQTAPRK